MIDVLKYVRNTKAISLGTELEANYPNNLPNKPKLL